MGLAACAPSAYARVCDARELRRDLAEASAKAGSPGTRRSSSQDRCSCSLCAAFGGTDADR